MTLAYELVTSLNLPDWNEARAGYRPDEMDAINRELSSFQKMANEELGGEAKFHPDVGPELTRKLTAQALVDLADHECAYADIAPANWKNYAATYLKAWVAQLDPLTLMRLGELFAKAGLRNEAKDTLRVVLLFPTYADTYYSGQRNVDLVDDIVNSAKEALEQLQ